MSEQSIEMGVLSMAGKSLRNALTDKTRNRDADVYRQALDLRGRPAITGSNKYLPLFLILGSIRPTLVRNLELPINLLGSEYSDFGSL